MARYRQYKNGLEMFLSSKRGRRVLNFAYSWGAAVVILGALFKLLHLPFGNEMLFIGMITEFLVFFISGFEQPEQHYNWEQVFPELDSKNPMDRQEMEARRKYLIRKAQEAAGQAIDSHTPVSAATTAHSMQAAYAAAPEGDVARLSASIDQLSGAAEQLSRLGQLSARMTAQWEGLQDLGQSTTQYQEQMASLSANLSQLNTIYETQLAGITGQVATIDQINRGLEHIKNMYQDSAIDSSTFRSQNERLAYQLSELNRVYARILDALTVSMGAPGMAGRPYQYDPGYRPRPDFYQQPAPEATHYPSQSTPQPRDPAL